ncbi:uncharacterized protein LOC135844139 isoform X1 [Planococcus citri]|uniref:uncharacterized protein LOC135844139 isoform X1 n=1 Tax=Planococcus citri TaxID=170843 RepID=UPI0031FA1BB0
MGIVIQESDSDEPRNRANSAPYTKRNDPYVKNGMPGIIIIRGSHNHPLNSPSAMKHLTTPTSIRDEFFEYFSLGMNIASASQYHENKILFEDRNGETEKNSLDDETLLGNAQMNPTKRAVQYWYMLWRNSSFGPRDGSDLLPVLDKRIAMYAADDIIIKYETDPFALIIVTPIMQRIHQCDFSRKILFIDTTSCCDHENYAITFLLSATPCGAVPCGVIITKDQTMNSFENAFKILQQAIVEKLGSSFFNQNYANVIMTDNCAAEIGAAKAIWPDSVLLLCIFHVLQYVLRWLQDANHKIEKAHQGDLMSTFQTILYSTDIKEADDAYESAMAIGSSYPGWQSYLQDQYAMKEKWCLAYRVGLTAHHTNNFAEISIRLFKENVLDRVKAYNLVALLDFIVTTMEVFYKRKLREFYNSRDRRKHLYLQEIFRRAEYIQREDIVKINEHTYEVPSQNIAGTIYTVDSEKATCNCKGGVMGKLCKHIAAVYQFYDVKNSIFPSITIEGRRQMAFVALGEKMPSIDYFLPLHVSTMTEKERRLRDNLNSNVIEISAVNVLETENELRDNIVNLDHAEMASVNSAVEENANLEKANDVEDEEYNFADLLDLLHQLNGKFGLADMSQQGVKKFICRLRKIRSSGQWVSFLHTAAKSVPLRRALGARIKVQPTAIQRRKNRNNRQPAAVNRRHRIAPKKNDKKHSISLRMYV